MFSRRHERTKAQKIREALWPGMGIVRLLKYYQHRLGRLSGSPYSIASGLATGVAISFTPLIGFHMILGTAIAWVSRASILAMVLGTLIGGNIWTLPLALLASYRLGVFLIGAEKGTHALPESFTFAQLMDHPKEYFLPMMAGSVPLFVCSWLLSYFLSRQAVLGYRARRHERIWKKHVKIHPEDA